MDFTYFNAVYTVENALSKEKDEKGMKRVEKFLKEEVCPTCKGTRLSDTARAPKICGIDLDVQTLLQVFQTLVEHGATVIVIEHDLDVMKNADYMIDMGPGGGEAGETIVAAGTPEDIMASEQSITGKYLKTERG